MRLIDADRLTASQSLSGVLYYPMTEIENAPTIDVERPTKAQFKRMAVQLGYEQVVHGRWDIMGETKTRRICSKCRWDVPEYGKFYSYCPNCGAKMDGAE